MARARSQPSDQPPADNAPVAHLAALPVGELAPATMAQTGGAAAVPVGGALTAAAAAKALTAILGAFDAFEMKRRPQSKVWLTRTLTTLYPERTDAEIGRLVREELVRDAEFRRRQRERVSRDMPEALKVESPEERRQAVQKILARERRYTQLREQAMAERADARANHLSVKAVSPDGAYWKLSEHVREHTPDCVAMGNKFWPWEVLSFYHPKLHPGCACMLLSKREAVEMGLMHEDQVPDVADAVHRAKQVMRTYGALQEAGATAAEIEEHIERVYAEPLLVSLAETRYALRFPRGNERGGEFRPRRGGDPGRRIVRKLLRDLVPHRPLTPRERRRHGVGEWQSLGGRDVFVPEHRAFERVIDGVRYRSPPGSTHVYSEPVEKRRPEIPVERGRAITDEIVQRRVENREEAAAVARRALEQPQERDRVPVEVGAHAKATHSGMLDAGFRPFRNEIDADRIRFHYDHHASGARASVAYAKGRVAEITWDPGTVPQVRAPLITGSAPETFDEFAADVFSLIHERGEQMGLTPHISRILHDPNLPDHEGTHHWDGVIELGRDVRPAIETLARARAEGRELTFSESREVYGSIRTAMHEGLHGLNPISQHEFRVPSSRALEERLTDEVAHLWAVETLRRYGADDVLRWVKAYPTDGKVDGSYSRYAVALDKVFRRARLEPEKYGAVVEALKFSILPEQRVDALAGLVEFAHPTDHAANAHEQARAFVDSTMALADEEAARGAGDVMFAPLVRADLRDVAGDLPEIEHDGEILSPGASVGVRQPDGTTLHGRVEAAHREGGTFLATVRYHDGQVEHHVTPAQIESVAPALPRDAIRGEVEIRGQPYAPGDLISWQNSLGRRSYARVERIVRQNNYDLKRWEDGWQIEARTVPEDLMSTAPDTPVLLSRGRALDLRKEMEMPLMRSPGGRLSKDERRALRDAVAFEWAQTQALAEREGKRAGDADRANIFRSVKQRIGPEAANRVVTAQFVTEVQQRVASFRRTYSDADLLNDEPMRSRGGRKWTRIENGYESGNARIYDNGAGVGPAAGGGRWAVEIDGKWIANVDTLPEAKERAERETMRSPGGGPEEFRRGPAGELYWMGWRSLKPGDRVVSWDAKRGRVLASGTVENVSESNRRGRRGKNVKPSASAAMNYVRVRWDSGTSGRVSSPAIQLRREEGPHEPDAPMRSPGGERGHVSHFDAFQEFGPITDDPPKFKTLSPGVYVSEDGRVTMYRIEGVHPPAWNVEWEIDYENAVKEHDPNMYGDEFLTSNIVDGAATKKDAEQFYRREWPRLRDEIRKIEMFSVSDLSRARSMSPGERGRFASWLETEADRARAAGEDEDTVNDYLAYADEVRALSEALVEGVGPTKPQACHYCKERAVGSFLWAEGRAYVPWCRAHKDDARSAIEDKNNDEVLREYVIEEAYAEHEHPRDRAGRWINKGRMVSLIHGGKRHIGTVVDFVDRPERSRTPMLRVQIPTRGARKRHVEVYPGQVDLHDGPEPPKEPESDAAEVTSVDAEHRKEMLMGLPAEAWSAGESDPLGEIRDALSASPVHEVYAKVVDGEVVAAMAVRPSSSFAGGQTQIASLGSKGGHGAEMVRKAAEISARNGQGLNAEAVPSAAGFYRKLGFKESGTNELGYPVFKLTPAEAKRLAGQARAPADDEPVDVGDDVERAATLLAQGRRVRLDQPRQVSTLLDKLRSVVEEAKAKGETAPNFDLCKVSVKGTNLFCAESKGIPRVQMPQLRGEPTPGSKADRLPKEPNGRVALDEAFVEHLTGLGVHVENTTEKASYLRASQRELNGAKVAGIAKSIEGGTKPKPIFVSSDNYVLDGHHNWAGAVGADTRDNRLGDVEMDIRRIDMPIMDVLDEARRFTKEWGLSPQGVGSSDRPAERVKEAFEERLHPRSRVGRWVESMHKLHAISKADVIAGKVPGFKYDPDVSPGVAAHMRDREHVTLGPGAFREMGKDVGHTSSLLMAHEIGHIVQQHIFSSRGKDGIDKIPEVQAFRGTGQTFTRGTGYIAAYDNPFGASQRPEEMVSDAYSELLHFGFRDPAWEALPGEKVKLPGHDGEGEVQQVFRSKTPFEIEVAYPEGKTVRVAQDVAEPVGEPESESGRKRLALLKLVAQAARELGLPDKRLYERQGDKWVPVQEAEIHEGFEEHLHPRDRVGRWRSKMGLPRLSLKKLPGEQSRRASEREVIAKAQKVADAVVDFYGGDKVQVFHEPEYLASVGSDARFRHESEVLSGILFGTRAMGNLRDADFGVEWHRVIAHEAAHSLSGVQPGPLPGFSQTVEEGGAEVLSLWFWKHRGQPFDERDATRFEGRWTEPGLESLANHVQYREDVAEVLKRAASKVGWDRHEIVDEVEQVFRGNHYDRLRWRDETTTDVTVPDGVEPDAVGLMKWLLADEARHEWRPSVAMIAADLVPADWQVEHGYGEWVPNVGFRHVPYRYSSEPGGMSEKGALRMLHHFFTGDREGWKGDKAQREEVEREAVHRWRGHMKRQGWQFVPMPMRESNYEEWRHLRDRLGRWIHMPGRVGRSERPDVIFDRSRPRRLQMPTGAYAFVEPGMYPDEEKQQMIDRTFDRISDVHHVTVFEGHEPRAIPVLMLPNERDPNASAWYLSHKDRDTQVVTPALFALSPGHDHIHDSALVHEIGHYLDQQFFGGGVAFGSAVAESDHPLHHVMEALAQTPEMQGLAHVLQHRLDETLTLNVEGETRDAPLREFENYFRYLLRPHEQFARAYTQWVALHLSEDDPIREQIDSHIDPLALAPLQWDWDSFEPVAAAFDRVFRAIGWRGST